MSTPAWLKHFSLVLTLLFAGLPGCNKAPSPAPDVATDAADGDPASGNLVPAAQSVDQTLPAPAPNPQDYDQNYNSQTGSETAPYGQPVESSDPPPPLPDYSQPPVPGDNYIWTPGYWNHTDGGYYWVPGVWILAPWVGALWTPPWWGYDNGAYLWHSGYWGPHIGYYGGVNYGFGYTGRGYYGAYWNHGSLSYNRAVTNVNTTTARNIYDSPVPNNRGDRISYNGGRGGIDARPTPQELAVVRDPRTPPVATQVEHARQASANRAQFATAGRAQPAALAAARPLTTPYQAPAARPPAAAMRAAEAARTQTPAQPNQRAGPQATGVPQNRPAPPQVQRPDLRSVPEKRPPVAVQQPQSSQPAPPNRPQVPFAAPPRPVPQARPEPHQAGPPRPSPPAARPQPRPAAPPRPAQQATRPQPRPAAPPPHPAPQSKEEHKKP